MSEASSDRVIPRQAYERKETAHGEPFDRLFEESVRGPDTIGGPSSSEGVGESDTFNASMSDRTGSAEPCARAVSVCPFGTIR